MTALKSKTTDEKSPLDTAKLGLAVLILAAGVFGFYWLDDADQLYRVLGMIGVVAVAAVLVFTTDLGRGLLGFAKESRTELRKVVWPTRQETLQTTLVVMVMVLVVAIFLWLLDMLLLWGVNALTGIGG